MTRDEFSMSAYIHLPQERREQEDKRTAAAIAELLSQPGRRTFPDYLVLFDGQEVPWAACDLAFDHARRDGGDGAMMDRWLANLHRGRRAAAAAEKEAMEKGYGVGGPTAPSRDERRILDGLIAPLRLYR